MSRNSMESVQRTPGIRPASGGRARRWLLAAGAGVLLAALPAAAQKPAPQPCSSARAVHDASCPNHTGFRPERLGGMVPDKAAGRSGQRLRLPEGAALGLRIGRDLPGGVASWYGPGFHGRLTANGERFDQNELTAAHKTLPFGTRVLVESPRTGKQVVVRINDRGPFVKGRVIDLSKAAAQALGLIQRGHDVVVLRELLPAEGGSTS